MVNSRSLESQITHLHRLNNLLLLSLCTPCLNTFHETLKKSVGLYIINVTSGYTKFQIFYVPSEKFTRECLFWVNIFLKLAVIKKKFPQMQDFASCMTWCQLYNLYKCIKVPRNTFSRGVYWSVVHERKGQSLYLLFKIFK